MRAPRVLLAVAALLSTSTPTPTSTPLIEATRAKDLPAVRRLIDLRVPLNAVDVRPAAKKFRAALA